ncbi:MAG: hypothetical protein QM817_10350 [Archangium sp.]
MRKVETALLLWPLLVLLALVPVVAKAGIPLNAAIRTEFTDCASGGSTAQALVRGDYLLRITDSDTFLCFAAAGSTCVSGGEKFPAGTVMVITVTGDMLSASCRSSGSTGDAIFTKAQ